MEKPDREITRIARIVGRFTSRTMKEQGIGMAEYDLVHAVRRNPGITQAQLRELLSLDKGAAARRTANLEAKGYIVRKPNPNDKRSKLLYPAEKAEALKESKMAVERACYEWLVEQLPEEERDSFVRMLRVVFDAAHAEFHADFPNFEEKVKSVEIPEIEGISEP